MKSINDSRTCMKVKVSSGRCSRGTDLLILNLGAKRHWVVNNTPRPLLPEYTATAPSMQEAGLAPGPVFTGIQKRKSLYPTGVRTPNRTVRSGSLYQPRYLGPPTEIYATVKWALLFLLESPPSLLLRKLTITVIYVWCTLSSC